VLTLAEAEHIQGVGMSQPEAEARIAEAGELAPLLAETVEEGEDLGRETQIGFVAGEAEAKKQLRARQAARVARFQGGGGAAGIGGPSSGLGSAG
jgi:hypothetical protein